MRAFLALLSGAVTWLVLYAIAAYVWWDFVDIFWVSYNKAVIGGLLVGSFIGLAGFFAGAGVFMALRK